MVNYLSSYNNELGREILLASVQNKLDTYTENAALIISGLKSLLLMSGEGTVVAELLGIEDFKMIFFKDWQLFLLGYSQIGCMVENDTDFLGRPQGNGYYCLTIKWITYLALSGEETHEI